MKVGKIIATKHYVGAPLRVADDIIISIPTYHALMKLANRPTWVLSEDSHGVRLFGIPLVVNA